VRDSCGISGTGETPPVRTIGRLTARPAESEYLERKSTLSKYRLLKKGQRSTLF
jgi:pyrroline-5-carboxylate reductase